MTGGEARLAFELVDDDVVQEACGVAGVMDPSGEMPVAQQVALALDGIQGRGEGAAGIFNNSDAVQGFGIGIKNLGLVSEVFPDGGKIVDGMTGNKAVMSVGQVRWATSEVIADPFHQAQPLTSEKIVVAHNGHIEGMVGVAESYGVVGTVSDSDALTSTLGFLSKAENCGNALGAMHELLPNLDGAYALVVADPEQMHGVRDPWGTRPLWMGRYANGAHIFASEQPVLRETGDIVEEYELRPGEIVSIDLKGNVESSTIDRTVEHLGMCALEGVYFARPDGKLDGRSVYASREAMGKRLAQEHPTDADVVIGVPDSGVIAAMAYAEESGIPYKAGIFRNPYTSRTFIQSSPEIRRRMVRRKLRPNQEVLDGKRVVVVDDSIVRGTSTETLSEILRAAGAKEVHFRISSAPFRHPCFSGTAISKPETLLARKHPTMEGMREALKADSLGFLSPEGLAASLGKSVGSVCLGCMTGEYPFQVPTPTSQGRPLLPITAR
jgi:amidophosphoribosyltransferase